MGLLNELSVLKWTPWYRWHPQLAMRYLPVVEWIRRFERSDLGVRQGRTFSVLEVGSGGLGIAPYLKRPVTGVDLRFDPPIHPLLTPVIGDATKLKFSNNSFDIVVSMDMLEHLPKEKRELSISEMLRVARCALAIGVPCGQRSLKHDRMIQDSYKKRHGVAFPFAEEHLRFGLPEETDILGYINNASKSLKKKIVVAVIGNTNLTLRKFLMWGWMSKNAMINILFRKMFLLLIPFFRALDRQPYYRQIFFVTVTRDKEQGTRYENL